MVNGRSNQEPLMSTPGYAAVVADGTAIVIVDSQPYGVSQKQSPDEYAMVVSAIAAERPFDDFKEYLSAE